MYASRRSFVRTVGLGALASCTGAAIAARGLEATLAAQVPVRGRQMALPADAIRIGSNEHPYGPGPHVVEAVTRALHEGNRYASTPFRLSGVVASYLSVPGDTVLMAAGSGDLLRASVLAFTAPDKPLATFSPTFEAPVRLATSLDVPIRAVPITGPALSLDIDALVDQSRGAGLVYLCNPNNPTGTFLSRAAVVKAIETIHAATPTATILVDEAYVDCADDPTYGSIASIAATTPNVLVLRTFSKIHGMAGLRIGYAVASVPTMTRLQRYAGSSVLSGPSAAAAMASLENTTYYQEQRKLILDTKAYLVRSLTEMGYAPAPSQGNFVMVDVKRSTQEFQAACREHSVMVGRPFPPLMTHSRISVGTQAEMERAVEVFRGVLPPGAPSSARR